MSEVLEQVIDPIQAAIDELLARGKARGYVTWEEMNEILPDDAIDPTQLEVIMMRLEEVKIETLDEMDAARYERRRKGGKKKRGAKGGVSDRDDSDDLGDHVESVTPGLTAEPGIKRIDDPVRMYLTQMGEIPLLTRAEEIRLAKKIELTRMAFRQKVLESDYCGSLAVEILQQVHDSTLPFDRTMKISTSEHMAKSRISARIPVNLHTVRTLLKKNDTDWDQLRSSRIAAGVRRSLNQGIRERRRKVSKLLEELSLRTSRIQPLMKRLRGLRGKMVELERHIAAQQKRRTIPDDDFITMKEELSGIESLCLEKSDVLSERLVSIDRVFSEYEDAKRKLSGGNLRGACLRRTGLGSCSIGRTRHALGEQQVQA